MTYSLDIAHLRTAYHEGTLTPEAVIGEVYDRIAADGERPVWITLVPREAALAAARKAPKGPLWGIPFAVKDNIDVEGLPTTCACPEFAYVPERTASVAERLVAAGAIVIGKTNLDQFATGLNGTRSPFGIPASTFDAAYISGGSSSGSAVAVAAGLVSFALGTDTAGSGRVPAAFNNIVGLKPTKGLFSARGVVPACRTQDTVSVFALTVADAALVARVAASFDEEDAFSREAPQAMVPRDNGARLRAGVPRGPLEFFGDAGAAELYARAVERARALGAQIVDVDLSPFTETAHLLYAGPWVAERLAAIETFARSSASALHPAVRDIILGAEGRTAVDAFRGQYRLAELRRRTEACWAQMDMLLLPTAPTTYTIAEMLADPLRLNSNLGLYTNFVNLLDLSALAVPAGLTGRGLPFGVTLIGPAFEDGRLAAFGDRLHRALDDARLGATETRLSETPAIETGPAASVCVAVVGAHLTGQPLNSQLTERKARLLRTAHTAKGYRLYALPGTAPPKPGLVYDGSGAGLIEVEVWEMSFEAFGSFVALIPAPLGIGTLQLEDGTRVKGFLSEAHAVDGAEDITDFGGWRAWLSGRSATDPRPAVSAQP